MNKAWGRFVRGLRGALAALVFGSVFVAGAPAQPADAVDAAIPAIDISLDRREIGDGRFRVDFGVPDDVVLSAEDFYIRVHSIEETETWSFSTLEASVAFASQIPGKRAVQGQLCRSVARDECGPLSKAVSVRIPNSVAVDVPAPEQGGDVGINAVGGPSFTTPGSFTSTKTKWNAWQLMWLNSLIHQQAPDTQPQPFFDLIVRWLTYEYDASLGRYVPIWLWAQLERSGTSSTWVGALNYRTLVNGSPRDAVIGSVQITPNSSNPKNVSVWWRSTRGGMYATQATGSWVSDSLEFADGLAPGTNPPPHDHMMGDWTPLLSSGAVDQRASIVTWIEKNQESLQFVFFDNAGNPVWARADWRDAATAPPTTGREEFCAFTVFDAIAPDTTPAPGHPLTLEWLGNCDGASGANVARSYDPVGPGIDRSGRVWADLTLPAYRPGRLVVGSSFSMREMIKLSHFHDIRPVIDGVDGKTTCTVDAGQNCTLDLRWVLEGIYPNAAVYRKALPSGSPVRIFSTIPGSEPGRAYTLPGSGTYEFQIRRTGSSSSDLLARSHPVEVISTAAETPPAPIPNPNFTADTATNTTGATRGEFRVDESGAGTYRIPIMTAPSGGGMAPEVALVYNSQSGNGVAGLGWHLEGASSITRCARTLEVDGVAGGVNLDANDRFCLDGQRLIQISGGSYGGHGTEYRLEVDQIVRIRSFGSVNGGPAYFQVWRKDGTVSWYGAVDRNGSQPGGARVSSKTAGTSSPTWRWNIGRIEDSADNFMQFFWDDKQKDSNAVETVLSRIDYSGHVNGTSLLAPLHRVNFVYELRAATDRAESYVSGAQLRRHYRLLRIVSRAEGSELRRYKLGYLASGDGAGRSVLSSLTECNGATCFAPTTFAWNSGPNAPGSLSASATPSFTLQSGDASKLVAQVPADLNGDGLNDLVFMFKNGSSNPPILKWRLAFRVPTGQIQFGSLVTGPALGGGVRSGDKVLPELRIIDIDADGDNDILYAARNSTTQSLTTFQVHRWNASTSRLDAAVRVGASTTAGATNLHVLDWDGDGLSDIAYAGNDFETLKVARNNGFDPANPASTLSDPSGFSVALSADHFPLTPGFPEGAPRFGFTSADVIDANGDGRGDLIMSVRQHYIPANSSCQPNSTYEGSDASTDDQSAPDGLSCRATQGRYILFQMDVDESKNEYTFRSTQVIARTDDDDAGGPSIKARDIQITDLNADGLVDVLYFSIGFQRWEHRLGRGDGSFASQKSINHWPTEDKITRHIQLVDINGDGHPDALFPSAGSSGSAVWQVSYWDWSRTGAGQGNFRPLVSTAAAAGNMGNGAQSVFADFNGSGKPDQLLIVPNSSGDLKYLFAAGTRSGGSAFSPAYLLRRVTDGFGAWTELGYTPLTDPAVYRRGRAGAQQSASGSAIYDVIPSIYVVSSATSLSPQYELNDNASGSTALLSGTTSVRYHYAEARIQGGGRGFLGFREVSSYDPQSGMLTRTRYRQDFPFIGLPEATRSWYTANPWPGADAPNFPAWVEASCAAFSDTSWSVSGKIFLGCSENTWAERATTAGLTHPYLAKSEEWSFNPRYSGSSMAGSDFTHRVVTENTSIDVYGNVGQVAVSTYTSQSGPGNQVARQQTVNTYWPPVITTNKWHLGRLRSSTVTSSRPDTASITRISTFGYDAATGILLRETVNAASGSDTIGSLTTTYTLDDFGNRKTTTVTGADIGPARKTRSLYDARGRFVNTEQVWLGGAWRTTRQVAARDRYGNPTDVTDAQGVTARANFDRMGRPFFSYTPDGAWTRTLRRRSTSFFCPSGAAFYEDTTASDGSRAQVCFDKLGRETRQVSWGFGGQIVYADTRYDYASRPIEVSEPYLSDQRAFWTRTVYDEIGRVEVVYLPDDNDERFSYTMAGSGTKRGIQTAHLDANNHTHRTMRNALGEKIEEVAADGGVTTYSYDALGQLITTDGPLAADIVTVEYDALGHKQRLIDPDKGTWRYRHNALGELTCQIDAKGQGVEIVYDELGRRTLRRDKSGVSNPATCAGTTRGTTSWTYGNTAQTPGFGQVEFESSQYNDANGLNHTTTRDPVYDSLGRLRQVDTTIAEAGGFNRSYTERTTYDQFGRVFQAFDAAGGSRGTRFVYDPWGHLKTLREARGGVSGAVYWQVLATDARGQATRAQMGNGMEVNATYDPATGRLVHKTDGNGQALAQDLELAWDAMGNLRWRHDRGGMRDQREEFFYDSRDRMREVRRRIGFGSLQTVQRLRYDAAGNIRCKSDVPGTATSCAAGAPDNYSYGAGTAGPHAATGAGNRTFEFDANGNVIGDRVNGVLDRQFFYTSHDKIRTLVRGAEQVEFHYGGDRARTLKVERSNGVIVRRTHYVGSVEVVWEGSNPPAGGGEYRRYIGGVAIATFFKATGVDQVRYLHTDHLGSTTAITDETGQIVAQMGFDAWGQRRPEDWSMSPWQQWLNPLTPAWAQVAIAITPRGYTGHEHVDGMGIIHMNGRIYDPTLGRFLQADPFVEDSTTLNRYTYVHNNPLSLTDPSGFFSFKKAFRTIASVAVAVAAGILTAGAGFTWSGFLYATLGGALSGGIATGSIEGALWGAFSGAAFFGIGAGFDQLAGPQGTGVFGTGLRKSQFALQSVSHGLAGGTIAEMQGGKFGHGFLSAGISKTATPGVGANIEGTFQQGFVLAIVGGTTSEISGGKFANGAVTAAMSFSFGQLAQRSATGNEQTDLLSMSDEELDALIEARTDMSFNSETAIAFQWPSLPQWTVDLAVGAGDGVWNAITLPARLFTDNPASLADVRGAMGIDGSVNYDSLAYRSSYVGGNVVGGTALYAGAAFNYVPALGPTSSFIGHPAYGGRTISGLRSGLRFGWGRGGNGPMLRGAYRNYKVDIHKMPK